MWIAAVGLRCMPPASRTGMYTSLRALFSTSLHGLDALVHRTAEWACSQSRKEMYHDTTNGRTCVGELSRTTTLT
eukprot:7098564-Alexandrium_andersonii.AAC.1